MPRPERQQNVLDLLKGLRGIEPLKELFWSELNYQRVNEPLSRRGWTDSVSMALADDPVLFAGGGEDNDFHVIYGRLASDRLLLGNERPVVSRLVKEHPYALFVFSNKAQDRWHFLNVKYDDTAEKRRLFRRITVGPEERLRTASERISLLSLDAISPELFGIAPLTIQEHHDEAFDKEPITREFFKRFEVPWKRSRQTWRVAMGFRRHRRIADLNSCWNDSCSCTSCRIAAGSTNSATTSSASSNHTGRNRTSSPISSVYSNFASTLSIGFRSLLRC